MPRGWYGGVEKMYAALRLLEMESAAFGAYRGYWRCWIKGIQGVGILFDLYELLIIWMPEKCYASGNY
jgi:hypothetical protein